MDKPLADRNHWLMDALEAYHKTLVELQQADRDRPDLRAASGSPTLATHRRERKAVSTAWKAVQDRMPSGDDDWDSMIAEARPLLHQFIVTDTDGIAQQAITLEDKTRYVIEAIERAIDHAGRQEHESEEPRTSGATNYIVEFRELEDPVKCVWVVSQIGKKAGRPDKLAGKMQRLHYITAKANNRWYCQRKDAIALYSRFKERLLDRPQEDF